MLCRYHTDQYVSVPDAGLKARAEIVNLYGQKSRRLYFKMMGFSHSVIVQLKQVEQKKVEFSKSSGRI